MANPDAAGARLLELAFAAVAAVVLVFLALRYVLKIDVLYVLSGGVPGVFAAETGVIGFVLGWLLLAKRR
jgi:hypothetical protein